MFKSITIYLYFLVLFTNQLYAKELKKISLQPSWFEQFQFAGYYIAKEKGFYNDVGLALRINAFEIKNQNSITTQINDGEIDFAIGKESLILENHHEKKIVILYALFQSSPLVLITTKKSNINKIEQFVGKTIMKTTNDAKQVSLKAMLNSKNIQLNDLNLLPHTHNINDLVNEKTDIISAYISKSPYDLQKKAVEYNLFSPHNYGFDLYSDFLYTSEEFIAQDIDSVKAFRAASLKGWQYAFANMAEAVDLIFEKYNQQNLTKEALLFEATAIKKLAYLNTDMIGNIDEHRLKVISQFYNVLGINHSDMDLSRVIYNATNPRLFLTKQETVYLEQKKKITICIDPHWLPYEAFAKDGKHIGLNTEYLNIFRKQLPIPIETVTTNSWSQSLEFAQQRKCDLLSLAAKTKLRSKYLNFTSPYLVLPHVLVTKSNLPFIDNFNLLAAKKIGIPKDYAKQDFIREHYPDIIIVEVENTHDGLEKVANGEIFGIVAELTNVTNLLQNQYLGQLKVSGKFDKKRELGIGVRKDDLLLLQIFEKLVTNLSEDTKKNITDKSMIIKYEAEFDYRLLWWLLFTVALIISAILYRGYILKNLNKTLNAKVSEKTTALQTLNESLEKKINERTKEIERSKEILQDFAFKDNLTNIFNRHYLIEKSLPLFNRACDLNEPLCILLIDIDLFKMVNDTYGHIVGDNILKYFVENIQTQLRVDDLFIRYGGRNLLFYCLE